jgi:hypothetical protein
MAQLSLYQRYPECHKSAVRRWQKANPEKCRASALAWRNSWTPDQRAINLAKQRARTFLRRYGITEEQYLVRLAEQNGHCALCSRTPAQERYKRLNVDHIHGTKTIRGLLCTPCNHALGVLGDDAEGIARALEYVSCRR